ncbi:mitochondrial Rho GTPase 2 [Tanacetum coccineum]
MSSDTVFGVPVYCSIRVVVVGDHGIGKSSLIAAAALENFPESVSPVLPATHSSRLLLSGGRKNKQTRQGSARTTSAVDLEEFWEKHYEKLLQIMADKYECEQRKKEKLEEVKARLDFGEARKKSTRAHVGTQYHFHFIMINKKNKMRENGRILERS